MTAKTKTDTTPRPRPKPIHPDVSRRLAKAVDLVRDCMNVEVSVAAVVETLSNTEQSRLLTLTGKLAEQPEWPVPPRAGPDERAAAAAFADALERLPAASAELREVRLLAEYTRKIRRLPGPAERAVFRGVGAEATVHALRHELRAAAEKTAPSTGGGSWWWSQLDEDEERELELLVEHVVGLGFFAKRRGEDALRLSIDELAAWAARPVPLRMLAPRGAAVLPGSLLDDISAGRLIDLDTAVVLVVALTFATRRIDPRVSRDVAWNDGKTLLVARGLHRLLPAWGPEVGRGIDAVTYERAGIQARLVATGWLEIETDERDVLHVRLGPRFKAKDRGE